MPKVVNHEERRSAIAGAAIVAIAEHGIDRVKMTDLARAAGCTVGALPHYFAGKDEILIAALRQVHRDIRERATRAAIESRFDPVRVWLGVLPVDAVQRREWRVWIAFASRASYSPKLAEEFDARYRQGHDDTLRMLTMMREMGSLPAELEIDAAAELMTAAIDGIGMRATLQVAQWPAERQRRQLERQLALLGYAPG